MTKRTKLERAKEFKTLRIKKKVSDEDIELILSWLKGDIKLVQVAKVYGYKNASASGNTYLRIAIILREAYQKGYLIIENER